MTVRVQYSVIIIILVVITIFAASAMVQSPVLMFSEASQYCSDTDDGINFFVKGVLVTSDGIARDYCLDEKEVIEYHCDSSKAAQASYACPNGCADGACLLKPKAWCSDSDSGMSPEVKGDARDSTGTTFTDFCENRRVLREGTCSDEKIDIQYFVCEGTCLEGRCT